jgi:fucose permease
MEFFGPVIPRSVTYPVPLGNTCALAGLVIVGFGCAPIYPCIIHSTPAHFGAENSQALVGVQMASAYMGNILMPPLFGVLANHVSIRLFPWYMLAILLLMAVMYRKMEKKTER